MKYSGYDADEEHVGLFEQEEQEQEQEEESLTKRNSIELIPSRRRRRSRKRQSPHPSPIHPVSPTPSESFPTSERVKKLRFSASDSDESDGEMYVGRTSCRSHGQFPRRWRFPDIRSKCTQRSSHSTQWPSQGSLVFLRGGVVGGTAGNLNDQLPKDDQGQTPSASLRLYSHMFNESRPQNESFLQSPLVSTSSGSTSEMDSLSSVLCNVASEPCSIADAVAFSSTPRLLLEAKAPHHVVHHNGAYESFLLQQPRWRLPEIQVPMQCQDLNASIQELFANQAATLQPVQVAPKQDNHPTTLEDVTHFLLELASSRTPTMAATGNSNSSDPVGATKATPSMPAFFSTALPAKAIG